MALHTDDIQLSNKGEWVEIPLLNNGTFVQVVYSKPTVIYVKVGNDTKSQGIPFSMDDSIKSPESIYARFIEGKYAIITVIRDGDK